VVRQQRTLVDQLAVLDGSVAELVTEKLSTFDAQRQRLAEEREAIVARIEAEQEIESRKADLGAWCQSAASTLSDEALTYQIKRWIIEALGVKVQIWRTDHEARWRIQANLPLERSVKNVPSQGGF
jgi:hypothetical protein